jgi:hypothetical protein
LYPKIPFFLSSRAYRDPTIPITQYNGLCHVTISILSRRRLSGTSNVQCLSFSTKSSAPDSQGAGDADAQSPIAVQSLSYSASASGSGASMVIAGFIRQITNGQTLMHEIKWRHYLPIYSMSCMIKLSALRQKPPQQASDPHHFHIPSHALLHDHSSPLEF